MSKNLLFTIVLLVILVTAYTVYVVNTGGFKPGRKSELDSAVNQAKVLYQDKKARGEDLSNGSCLSNALMPGWVADIVHSPRQPIDDLVENQCSAYVAGQAKHFVELDTNGNLVRAR